MTQPTQPAPSSAPPDPTTAAPPTGTPPTGQPQPQPSGQQPQQGGWPPHQQPGQGYPPQQQPGYPQGQPVQYVPVMPIPPHLAQPPSGDGTGGGEGGEADLTKLPQWAQRQIQTLRDENAKRRVSERTAVVNQHAWMAAQQFGANAQAVLGSLAWQQAAEGLDPSKPDFGRHLAEAIYRTVQQNPWMGQQQAYPPPATGGPGQPQPGQQGQPGQPPGPGQQPAAPGTPPGQPQQPYPAGPYGQPGWPQPYPGNPGGPQPPGYPPAPGYPAPQMPPGWLRPPTSGADFATGNNAGAPITEAQLAQMTPEQITEALEQGKLKHLM